MELVQAENPDGKWWVYDDDYIGRELIAGERWEPWVLDAIAKHANRKTGVFVDVGAYIGTHAIPAARLFKRVIAFEPYPLFANLLRRNVALNELDNVTVKELALGIDNRSVSMHKMVDPATAEFPQNYAGDSRLVHGGTAGVRVTQHSLDHYKLSVCTVLKIDTQGTEFRVLKGAVQTIRRCRPIVFIEGSQRLLEEYRDSFADIRRFLRQHHYHIDRLRKNTADFVGVPR